MHGTTVLIFLLTLILSLQVRVLLVELLLFEPLTLLSRQLAQSILEREAVDCAAVLLCRAGRCCPCGLLTDLLLLSLCLEVANEGSRGCRDGIVNSLDLLVQHVLQVLFYLRISHQCHDGSPVLVENGYQLRPQHIRLVLVQAEYDVQNRIAILKLLHVVQVCVDYAALELQEELLIAAEVLAHEEGILFVDSVVVDD